MKNLKVSLTLFLICVFGLAESQSLRDINYSYEYNPGETFSLRLKPVKEVNQWKIFYKFENRDTSVSTSDLAILWETRETIADKQNSGSSADLQISEFSRSKTQFTGVVTIEFQKVPKIIVAKAVNNKSKRAWIFYRTLEENYPVCFSGSVENEPLFDSYIWISDSLKLSSPGRKIVSYYDDDFPVALPPFSEAQGKVSKVIKTDSTLFIKENNTLTFFKRGLYLIQSDTNSTQGLSVRAEDDYPKFTKVPSLAGPLIYICTKQENDRLVLAKNDKRAFDRVILGITQDTERAKKLIRNYFRRVEHANELFTSYKEGWKTDRGMIYIIFGPPEQVYKFNDREVWTYKTSFDVTFNFTKSSSVFDPDNYVLIRNKKYQQLWYEVIDMWRDARF